MKEFDLKAAKKGAPVQTRDGHNARIVSFDFKDPVKPLVVIIEDEIDADSLFCKYVNGISPQEGIWLYSPNGKRNPKEPQKDLVMAVTKHEGWVNIYRSHTNPFVKNIYHTKEQAEAEIYDNGSKYITTVKIEWEE
jgi:hypothetical protein